MKKKLLIVLFFISLIPLYIWAGEVVDTPQDIVIGDPLTDKIDKLRFTFYYDSDGNHSAIGWYNVMDATGTRIVRSESFSVHNKQDNPQSITAGCTGVGVPWELCTGAGTCTNDCDESTTDFTDFVDGFGSTLKARIEAGMWQDIQSKYTTQAKP